MVPLLGNRCCHGSHFVPHSLGVVLMSALDYEVDRTTRYWVKAYLYTMYTLCARVTLTYDLDVTWVVYPCTKFGLDATYRFRVDVAFAILHVGSCPESSYIFQVSWKSVEGSRSCGGSKIVLSHWLIDLAISYTRVCTTVQAVIMPSCLFLVLLSLTSPLSFYVVLSCCFYWLLFVYSCTIFIIK